MSWFRSRKWFSWFRSRIFKRIFSCPRMERSLGARLRTDLTLISLRACGTRPSGKRVRLVREEGRDLSD
jgi:hypothetical protein